MNAGKLRHRLLLEQPIVTQDDTGGEVINWSVFRTVWASVEPLRGRGPLRGREQLIANQSLAPLDTRIRIRWSPAVNMVTAKWRGTHQGIIYNFKSISQTDMGHREIEIMAQSGLNDG